jgi:hypothetical protein
MQLLLLGLWADLQIVPVLCLGHRFDGETALRSYFSGFVGTVRFPSCQVVLEADRSQQNMVDVKHLLAVTLIKGTVLSTRH